MDRDSIYIVSLKPVQSIAKVATTLNRRKPLKIEEKLRTFAFNIHVKNQFSVVVRSNIKICVLHGNGLV